MKLYSLLLILLLIGCSSEPAISQYGKVRLYPSILKDVKEISNHTFKRGNHLFSAGYVWTYFDSGSFDVDGIETYCYVFWHELGHVVLKQSGRKYEYCLLKGAPITPYAATNCDEDFAENYVHYKLGVDFLKNGITYQKKNFIKEIDLFENYEVRCID